MAEVRSLSKPDAMTIRLLWKSSITEMMTTTKPSWLFTATCYLDDVDTQLASLGEDGRNEQMQWEDGRTYDVAERAFLSAQFAHELMSNQLLTDQLNKKL